MNNHPHHPRAKALQRIRWVTHLLDNAIPVPGTKVRFGLDPILGLFPGAGDWLSSVLSIYIVLESLRFRLPKAVLTQMVTNLLLDTAAGAVPVVGDLFDVTWKANHRNLKLLEASLDTPMPQQAANRGFVVALVVVLLGLLAMMTLVGVLAAQVMVRLFSGGA